MSKIGETRISFGGFCNSHICRIHIINQGIIIHFEHVLILFQYEYEWLEIEMECSFQGASKSQFCLSFVVERTCGIEFFFY